MLEIRPTGDPADVERAKETSHDVIDRVIRRAEELRRNWLKANEAGTRSSSRASRAVTV
jgi:hypothetical protein